MYEYHGNKGSRRQQEIKKPLTLYRAGGFLFISCRRYQTDHLQIYSGGVRILNVQLGVTAFCAKPMFMSDIRDTLMTAIGQMQAEAEDTMLPAAGSDFRGRCILLVEDNELNSEITVEILNEYGFLVDTAGNGAQAVEKVKNSKPGNYDLVLMDVQMPVMNGYEATRQIRALNDPALAGITILAMTANAFDDDRKKALECGMDGFLTKPIVIEELIGTIQKNLEQVSGVSEKPHK